jgi:hypothetical protein
LEAPPWPREGRHSFFDLTVNIHTDPTLPNVAGTMNALPDLAVWGWIDRAERPDAGG